MKSLAEAKKFLKDNKVKYVLAQFVDIHGVAKVKSVPAKYIATINFAPVLSSSVAVHDINFNDGKFISIAGNTLSIGGAVKGNGAFKGSASSSIIIEGKAGSIRFTQGSSSEKKLQYLSMQESTSAVIATDAEINNLVINPSAVLTVADGVKLITH